MHDYTFDVLCLSMIYMYLPVNVIFFEYVNLLILWNYFYLWGSRLVSSQNCPGSLGHNFVGGIIGIPLINIKQRIVYTLMASYICEQRLHIFVSKGYQ